MDEDRTSVEKNMEVPEFIEVAPQVKLDTLLSFTYYMWEQPVNRYFGRGEADNTILSIGSYPSLKQTYIGTVNSAEDVLRIAYAVVDELLPFGNCVKFDTTCPDTKAESLGGKCEGGINWGWYSFKTKRGASEFLDWLEKNGYRTRGEVDSKKIAFHY